MFNRVGPISIDWRNIFDRFYWRGIGGLVDRKRTLLPNWCLVYSTDTKETKNEKIKLTKIFLSENFEQREDHRRTLQTIWSYVVWRRETFLVIRQVIEDLDLTHSIIVGNRLSNKGRPPKKYTFFATAQIALSIQYFQNCWVFSVILVYFSGSVILLVKSKK